MNTPLSYVGQPIRSLQTMLRTIAHVDETLLKLVPDGIYGPNTCLLYTSDAADD